MNAMSNVPSPEFLNESEIAAYQLEQLKGLIGYLQQNSKHYQHMFLTHGISVSSLKSLQDLAKIPTTGKEELCAKPDDFLCVPKSQIAEYTTTSGSMSEPASVFLTMNDIARLAKNEARSMMLAGCSSEDIFQLATTMDKRFMAGLAYFEGVRKLGAGLIRVGASSPALQWDSILRFKPTVLIAIPSFVLTLIEYAKSNGIELRKSSLKKVIAIGQPVRTKNLELNNIGKKIATDWGLEIYSTYASTEMAAAFTECSYGAGGHLQPDLIYAEVLDEQNQPVAHGEQGEIVISTFGVEAMPLLRYRTGDIAVVYKDQCHCGRNTLRLGPIIGRKNHILKYKGTTIHPSSLIPSLDARSDCKLYLIELSTDELGLDVLTILFSREQITDEQAQIIVNDLSDLLKVKPQFRLIDEQKMQSIILDPSSRKPIKILDIRIAM
jgi:phenylacetate-CoA ligase